MAFVVGQLITATCAITSAGVPFDPATVFAWSVSPAFTQPDGTRVPSAVTQLSVTRLAAGSYAASFAPGVPNTWIVRFADSLTVPANSNFASESKFAVDALDY